MGASFVNVQVLNETQSGDGRLIEALIESAQSQGMVIADDDQTESDRTIVIVSGQRWISIYDEAAETETQEYVDALAVLASTAIDSPAISIQVYDSDICELRLFQGRKRMDRYNSRPAYWLDREVTAEEAAEAAGNPERWSDLLAAGHTQLELAKCWAEERTFAEETVLKTAELIGCAPELMAVGYRYVTEELLPEGARELRFRLRDRPSWETQAAGPPKFAADIALAPDHRCAVGDELMFYLQLRNAGGEGKGVCAFAWGDALANELVAVESFVVMVGRPDDDFDRQVLVPVLQPNAAEVTLQASAPDLRIPAGIAADLESTGINHIKVLKAMQQSSVRLIAKGRVLAPGKGRLALALSPMENHQDGGLGFATEVMIDPPLYRPLHAQPIGHSQLLRPLVHDTFLVGMIVMDTPRRQFVDIARATFEDLATKYGGSEKYEIVIYYRDPDKRPKSQKARSERFFVSAKWDSLREVMCDEQQVKVLTESTPPTFDTTQLGIHSLHAGGHGLIVGGGHFDIGTADDPELPAVCWWADVSQLSAEQVAYARNLLMDRIDAAMQSGRGVQAFLSRWGQEMDRLDSTPYELACQLSCAATTLRSWSTRWLRAMGTESNWLGPSLRKHLDRECEVFLREQAEVADVGRSLRIRPHSRDSLPDLEKELASILPSQSVAKEASEAYYARLRGGRL